MNAAGHADKACELLEGLPAIEYGQAMELIGEAQVHATLAVVELLGQLIKVVKVRP